MRFLQKVHSPNLTTRELPAHPHRRTFCKWLVIVQNVRFMEIKKRLRRRDTQKEIKEAYCCPLSGTWLRRLANLNGVTNVNCLIPTVVWCLCWRVSLFAGKTHSSIQEWWDVTLPSYLLKVQKKKILCTIFAFQCKSEISCKEKDLVRKTKAKYRSDSQSRERNNSISANMTNSRKFPLQRVNCWQVFPNPGTTRQN